MTPAPETLCVYVLGLLSPWWGARSPPPLFKSVFNLESEREGDRWRGRRREGAEKGGWREEKGQIALGLLSSPWTTKRDKQPDFLRSEITVFGRELFRLFRLRSLIFFPFSLEAKTSSVASDHNCLLAVFLLNIFAMFAFTSEMLHVCVVKRFFSFWRTSLFSTFFCNAEPPTLPASLYDASAVNAANVCVRVSVWVCVCVFELLVMCAGAECGLVSGLVAHLCVWWDVTASR